MLKARWDKENNVYLIIREDGKHSEEEVTDALSLIERRMQESPPFSIIIEDRGFEAKEHASVKSKMEIRDFIENWCNDNNEKDMESIICVVYVAVNNNFDLNDRKVKHTYYPPFVTRTTRDLSEAYRIVSDIVRISNEYHHGW